MKALEGDRGPQDGRALINRRGFLGVAAGSAVVGAGGLLTQGSQAAQASQPTLTKAREVSTGPPPITVTVAANNTAPGNILLTPSASSQYQHGPLIIDSSGNVIKFLPMSPAATTLQRQSYKQEPVLTFWQGTIVQPGYGQGVYKILDTSYNEVTTLKAGYGLSGDLHEFVVSPQGTALITAYRKIPYDLSAVGGPSNGTLLDSTFQEIDVATGKVLMKWRASAHVHLRESYLPPPTSSTDPYDFFHINSVDFDGNGDLLVSGRHTWCLYKIDRSTGNIIWRMNGKRSNFKMGSGANYFWQHHARHHANNVITVFDDGAGPTQKENQSRGLKLQFDTTTMTVKLLQQYLPNPSLVTAFLGSMQILPNGNVFISWGGSGYFSEYTAGGNLLYDAHLPAGINTYRAFRYPWPV